MQDNLNDLSISDLRTIMMLAHSNCEDAFGYANRDKEYQYWGKVKDWCIKEMDKRINKLFPQDGFDNTLS